MSREELLRLAERVEALTGPDRNRQLDEDAANELGWFQRKVTGLGLNGRTPGRWLWFPPFDGTVQEGRALPNLTGPRKRKATAAALKALAVDEQEPGQ